MSREGLRILEKRAVSGVRVREQRGIRQVFGQPVRVAHRNHLVMEALHDQRGMAEAFQVGEPLTAEMLPLAKRGCLRLGYVRAGGRFTVVLSAEGACSATVTAPLAPSRETTSATLLGVLFDQRLN